MPLLAPGTVLSGRYVVGRVLGGGGMGEVYEAVQIGLSRRVAIKLLKPELAKHGEMLSRFRREAEAAAALGHPNIVQVTDLCVGENEPPYLVMEHLEGRSLQEIIATEGRLQSERAVFIALQLLSALGAAHAAGIVHRDIKPGNVFVLQTLAVSDIVKLLDFGVAKLIEPDGKRPLTAAGEILGTTSYMAPEQALGVPVDARADIFAVGAVLFHALSGVRPREPGNAEAAAFERIKKLEEVSPWLESRLAAVVDRALHRDPEGRYASAEEMARELRQFVPRAGVFDQTIRNEEDPMESTQQDPPHPMPERSTESMRARPQLVAPTPLMTAVPVHPSVPAPAGSSPVMSQPVAPTVIEAPIRDSRQPPPAGMPGGVYPRQSFPAPSPSNRSLLPPQPVMVPPRRRPWIGIVIGVAVVVLTGLVLVVGLVGYVWRRGVAVIDKQEELIASATACPKPLTCSAHVTFVHEAVQVCSPAEQASTLVARGDVVVARHGGLQSLGRVEEASGASVSVRDATGAVATFPRTEIEARVCR